MDRACPTTPDATLTDRLHDHECAATTEARALLDQHVAE